ncbi:MAG: zinc-binding dehydrogenase [Armatimonadetes bacterium]|nr:zinc-binding dehydrogenase [Armatimonadota bacterium]
MSRVGQVQVFWGPERGLSLEELPVPEPQGAEILVRVTACTLCGSDLHSYTGRRAVSVPTVLGHEIIGEIDSLGPSAPSHDFCGQPLRVGDRVTWALIASCGTCFYCCRALPQKCERQVKYGHEKGIGWTGGLGEFCLLAPGTALFRLPDTLPDAAACPLSCATATVAAALRSVGGVSGKAVLIQGAGMLGLAACGLAKAAGAALVLCADPDPVRRARAEEFGADVLLAPEQLPEAVRQATGGYGADVALELSGVPVAFTAGLLSLRLGGSFALVGAVFPAEPVALQIETLVRRNLPLIGVHNYLPEDLATALRFLASPTSAALFESLVTAWFPLASAAEAFQAAHEPGAFRVGVRISH